MASKVVCTFNDGNVHTFTNEDPEKARHWFEILWGVEGMVRIGLFINGVEVASKSVHKEAA